MNGHSTEVKYWSPKLIQLTTLPNPDVVAEVQTVFVDPTMISLVYRGMSCWNKADGTPAHLPIECTLVWLRGGGPSNIPVIESLIEVAQRRNLALEVPVELGVVR